MSSGEQRQRQLHDYTEEVARLVPEHIKPIDGGKKVRETENTLRCSLHSCRD